MMVTMVPPDSGPRMGLSDSTEGFFRKKQRNSHSSGFAKSDRPRLDVRNKGGTVSMLWVKVLFLPFLISSPGAETVSKKRLWHVQGRQKHCVLELINSLGNPVLITLMGRQR